MLKHYIVQKEDHEFVKHSNPLEAEEEARRLAKKENKVFGVYELIAAHEKMPATRAVDIQETNVQWAYTELKDCIKKQID